MMKSAAERNGWFSPAPQPPTAATVHALTVYVDGIPREAATYGEAKAQADRRLGEAIAFACDDGAATYEIRLGEHVWRVLGWQNNPRVTVVADGVEWTRGQVVACLQRRWGPEAAEAIRHQGDLPCT